MIFFFHFLISFRFILHFFVIPSHVSLIFCATKIGRRIISYLRLFFLAKSLSGYPAHTLVILNFLEWWSFSELIFFWLSSLLSSGVFRENFWSVIHLVPTMPVYSTFYANTLELVSKELHHLASILHGFAGVLITFTLSIIFMVKSLQKEPGAK